MREGSLIITTHTLRIPFSPSSTFFSHSLCAERETLQRGRQRLQSLVYSWSPWTAWHNQTQTRLPAPDPVPLTTWAWFRRELVSRPIIPANLSGWEMQERSLMLLLDTKALVIFRKGNPKKKHYDDYLIWRREGLPTLVFLPREFHGQRNLAGYIQVALVVKNPPANTGDRRDVDSIPESGRSPRGGNGNPLQCSCLENPHGQRRLADYNP